VIVLLPLLFAPVLVMVLPPALIVLKTLTALIGMAMCVLLVPVSFLFALMNSLAPARHPCVPTLVLPLPLVVLVLTPVTVVCGLVLSVPLLVLTKANVLAFLAIMLVGLVVLVALLMHRVTNSVVLARTTRIV